MSDWVIVVGRVNQGETAFDESHSERSLLSEVESRSNWMMGGNVDVISDSDGDMDTVDVMQKIR